GLSASRPADSSRSRDCPGDMPPEWEDTRIDPELVRNDRPGRRGLVRQPDTPPSLLCASACRASRSVAATWLAAADEGMAWLVLDPGVWPKLIQQCPGFPQIRGLEAFREPTIDRRQQAARLARPAAAP